MRNRQMRTVGGLTALLALVILTAAPGVHAFAHIAHEESSHLEHHPGEAEHADHDVALDHDHGEVHPDGLHRVTSAFVRATLLVAPIPSGHVSAVLTQASGPLPGFVIAQPARSRAPPPGDPARAPPV